MKTAFATFVWITIYQFSNAQYSEVFTASTQVADALSADTSYAFSYYNPASSAYVLRPRLSASFQSPYLISELGSRTLSIYFPLSFVKPALHFQHTGFSVFHTVLYGLSLARKYHGVFALGMQFNGFSIFQQPTNSYLSFSFWQIGAIYTAQPKLKLGFYLSKPLYSNEIVRQNVQLPSFFSIGGEYDSSDKTTFVFQTKVETWGNLRISGGINYSLNKLHRVGAGLMVSDLVSNDLTYQIHWEDFRFGARFILHPILGLSIVSSLSYEF